MKNTQTAPIEHPIIIYRSENTNITVNVRFENETFLLTQKTMAELFECSTDNISLHLKHIFDDEELNKESVTEESSVTAADKIYYLFSFEGGRIYRLSRTVFARNLGKICV